MKGSEIFVGILIACMFLVIFYKYLSWGNDHIDMKEIYDISPGTASADDEAFIKTYGRYLPNRLMVDSYKNFNYLRLYYMARYFGMGLTQI